MTNFETVIGRLNRSFGADFHGLEATPENERAIHQMIAAMDRADPEGGDETTVVRPSVERESKAKEARRAVIADPAFPATRSIYEQLEVTTA